MTIETFEGKAVEQATADDFGTFGTTARRKLSNESMKKANDLLLEAFAGNRRARVAVREAFSTSDFTLAAFATIDKETREIYQEFPSVWREYASQTMVNDFREKYIIDMLRGQIGLEVVPELTEYPTMGSESSTWSIAVKKYGARFAASWEAWLNDTAIDEIQDWPRIFAQAAAETDAITAVSQLVSASGINTTFFNAGNGNAPGTAALTLDSLDAALEAIPQRTTAAGRPIYVGQSVLLVPPALKTTANRIVSAREIRKTDGTTETIYDNYLNGEVKVVVEPMLTVVNTSANANSTWFLLPAPDAPRKSVYVAHLRGHESADIRWKVDQGQRAGGGAIGTTEGSFDVDDIQVRVRHVVGGGTADPLPTYVSDGSA